MVEAHSSPEQQAEEPCRLIMNAARHMEEAVRLRRLAVKEAGIAQTASIEASMGTSHGIRVVIKSGDYFVVRSGEHVEEHPPYFQATEFTAISESGVQFRNRKNGDTLYVLGFDFEVMIVEVPAIIPASSVDGNE